MKRLFSKKSGFTLVEIIVAFAIFAIMATMILSMVQLTVKQRNLNNQFADNIENDNRYLAEHYIGDSDKYDSSEAKSGTFNLTFPSAGIDAKLDYQLRGNPEYTNEAGGVNYFVGKTEYTGVGDMDDDGDNAPVEGFGNQQDSRYTTWITGTEGIEYVAIENVVKDTSYTGPGVRYFIKCMANGSGVEEDYKRYSQYRLSFRTTDYSEVKRTDADGNTKKYKVYKPAKILEFGYVNSSDLVWNDATCEKSTAFVPRETETHNKYIVEQTSTNTLHFTCPYRVTGYGLSSSSKIWVVFEDETLVLNESSFGDNGTAGSGTTKKYYNYSGEYTDNIFGAFELEEITGS